MAILLTNLTELLMVQNLRHGFAWQEQRDQLHLIGPAYDV